MKFLTGALVAILAISVLAMPVLGSEVGIQFLEKATGNEYGTQANPIQMCTGPLTIKDVAIKISNMGASTDTYKFSLYDLPEGWTGQIQSDVMLAPGESKVLDLFVLNNYYTEPGTYFFTIKAESGTDEGYMIPLKRIQVDILPCFTFVLEPEQQSAELCEESPGDVNFTLILKNAGKFAQTFDLSTSSDAAKPPKGSITLEPNQSTGFVVTANSAGMEGAQKIRVEAKSRTTQATESADVTLDVKDCYSSEASIAPDKAPGCIGKQASYKLLLKNTGIRSDSFSLSAPDWISVEPKTFGLAANESKEVDIKATPTSAGELSIDVSIESGDRPSTKKVSAVLDAAECRDIVIITSPASSTTCKGGIVPFDVTVKNRGILEDTIIISATAGSLSINKLTLAPSQSQTLQLNVDTSAMAYGKNSVEVTASDGKVSDKSSVDINVEDCYSSKLELVPDNKTVCPFAKFNYTLKLTNTGKLSDSFVARFKDITESATLASGQSASWDIPVYSEESGAYSLTATSESNRSRSNATATLVVQPLGKCYAVDVKSEQSARANVLEASTATVTIKNTGTVADSYRLAIAGPSWAYISPDNVTLEPGMQADVYLYLSPPRDADNSTAKVVIGATSNHAAGSAIITAFVGNASPPSETGGALFSNITGAFIYEDGSRPLWKIVAIAVIALAIIIILIVRFVLLVKG